MIAVIFFVIESHDFRSFSVVHVIWAVVVFVEEFLNRSCVELFGGERKIFDFDGS